MAQDAGREVVHKHSFDLHAPEGANRKKRIVGRGQGCGRGTTSGRGNKGQKSRSGGKTYVGFEGGQMPLYRRLAQRGFSNHPFKKSFQIVNLNEIDKRYNDGETVDELSLINKRLIKGRKKGDSFAVAVPVKILGNGDLTKKLNFKTAVISGPAREKILKSGGTVPTAAPAPGANSAGADPAGSEQ
jgi:large subunit ribosomal protein L15